MLCWFHPKPLDPNGVYFLRHTTRDCKAKIKAVRYKIDINTLHKTQRPQPRHERNRRVKLRRRFPFSPTRTRSTAIPAA